MRVRITVEVFGDDGNVTVDSNQHKAIAEGKIVGDLNINGTGTHADKTKPILSVRMRNILACVQETILLDSTNA